MPDKDGNPTIAELDEQEIDEARARAAERSRATTGPTHIHDFMSRRRSISSSSPDRPPPSQTDGVGRVSEERTSEGVGGGRVGSERSGEEEEEIRPQNVAPQVSSNGVHPVVISCPFCGPVAAPHVCLGASRFEVPVPNEMEELVVYLITIWDIHYAELLALECGPESIRWAVRMVSRGTKDGEAYSHAAGLIVKLARRLSAANRRKR